VVYRPCRHLRQHGRKSIFRSACARRSLSGSPPPRFPSSRTASRSARVASRGQKFGQKVSPDQRTLMIVGCGGGTTSRVQGRKRRRAPARRSSTPGALAPRPHAVGSACLTPQHVPNVTRTVPLSEGSKPILAREEHRAGTRPRAPPLTILSPPYVRRSMAAKPEPLLSGFTEPRHTEHGGPGAPPP
jgi:hypothetical protein